jgi:hypothetical protein
VFTRYIGYPTTVLADKPIAYFRLDETISSLIPGAADSSTSVHHGSYHGDVTTAIGLLAREPSAARDFRTSGNVTIPDAAHLNFVNAPFTIEALIKGNLATSSAMRVFDKSAAGTGSGYGLEVSGNLVRLIGTPSLQVFVALASNTTYHLAGVSNGSGTGFLYVNGALVGSGPYASPNPYTGSAHIAIASDGSAHFNGTIDEVSVYNSALTANQIRAHYVARDGCNGATDVTPQVRVLRNPFLAIPPLFQSYVQTTTFLNNTPQFIPGPISLVFDDFRAKQFPSCPDGCIIHRTSVTHCGSYEGNSILEISSQGLQPGQAVRANIVFSPAMTPGSPYDKFLYTPRVLSGNPNQ